MTSVPFSPFIISHSMSLVLGFQMLTTCATTVTHSTTPSNLGSFRAHLIYGPCTPCTPRFAYPQPIFIFTDASWHPHVSSRLSAFVWFWHIA
ncbi:hypothetical protein BC628DRAFT_645547 [Trametes gibbosa]|nr:hypothetical protein BC628DRAFT_645547 [Trametes gibbosa]